VIQDVSTNSYVFAMGNCYGPGSITVTGVTTKVCNYSSNPVSSADRRGKDPGTVAGHGTSFDPPAAPTVTPTVPPCTGKKLYELQPGLYTSATALSLLTNGGACAGSIVHFNPGTYYFNFQDVALAHKWTTSTGWVVAGTPTSPLSIASPPAMTQASPSCVGPGTTGSTTTSGVQFVFGGDSRMDYTGNGGSTANNANMEICASNSSSGLPVAIYGLKTTIGAGSMTVPAMSGCITASGYPANGDSSHCAILQSYQDVSPTFTVHGTVYTPPAVISIVFNGSSAQYFQWGLVARSILINSTGSASSLVNSVISVPNNAPAPFALPNLMYLEVFVCHAQSTCNTSGRVRLRAKVQLSVATPTKATILTWSEPRSSAE